MIFPQAAVKLIGPTAVRCVDHRPGATPEFSAVGVGLHLELLDGVRGDLDDLARKTLIARAISIVVDTVQQEIVDRVAQTVDIKSRFTARGGDAVLGRFAD